MEKQIEHLTNGWLSPEEISSFFALEKVKTISREFNRKMGTVTKGAGKEYRQINHWDSEGLISSGRESDKQWRKFSTMDMIWLDIIEDLRAFGFSLEKIRKIKEQLCAQYQGIEAEYPLLELFIFLIVGNYDPVFLKISPDAELKIVLQQGLNENLKKEGSGRSILLTLNEYVRRKLPHLYVIPCYLDPYDMNDQESSLIETLRANTFSSIKIRMKEGRIDLIEGTEKIEARNKRIVDLLNEEGYQNIELKQENGKIVCINRTIRRKI